MSVMKTHAVMKLGVTQYAELYGRVEEAGRKESSVAQTWEELSPPGSGSGVGYNVC